MGHWYPWATREYILYSMSYKQVALYYRNIPPEGRLRIGKKPDYAKPDLKKLSLIMGGKKRWSR